MTDPTVAISQVEAARDLTLKVIDRMGVPPDIFKRRDGAEAGRFVASIYREIYAAIRQVE